MGIGYDFSPDPDVWGSNLPGLFGSAAVTGSSVSYGTDRTSDTVTNNAIDSGQPIVANDGGSWGDFWQKTLGSLVSYGIQRDAIQSGVSPRQTVPQYSSQQQQQQNRQLAGNGLVMLLLVGGLAYVIAKG